MKDFLLHIVAVIWADTPKSAANTKRNLTRLIYSNLKMKDCVNLSYMNQPLIKLHSPNLTSPTSVKSILAP